MHQVVAYTYWAALFHHLAHATRMGTLSWRILCTAECSAGLHITTCGCAQWMTKKLPDALQHTQTPRWEQHKHRACTPMQPLEDTLLPPALFSSHKLHCFSVQITFAQHGVGHSGREQPKAAQITMSASKCLGFVHHHTPTLTTPKT